MSAAKYIAIIFALAFVDTSFACTCINSKPLSKKEFKGYDTIVKVKILAVTTGEGRMEINAEAIELYKGRGIDSTLVVITEPDPGMCGIDPKVGEIWMIYSVRKGEFSYTDQCTKSRRIDPEARMDRHEAKRLKKEMRFLKRHVKKDASVFAIFRK